ncbi:deoxyribonuclease I [Pseudomonas syringae pv. actinidiae]|nr:deoxyribonuclease I [Pseudomonas syringae pv. actinidiae]
MRLMQLASFGLLLSVSVIAVAAPDDFSQAKRLLREQVYSDQSQSAAGDFYCGCKWEWVGKSGGRMDPEACGFQSTQQADRATRLEWEHTVAISAVAQQRECWRDGGRENCQRTDPVFNRMEGDMFNLVPSIGTVNALRSNTNYGMVAGPSVPLGACTTKIGTSVRVVEPRNEVKGEAARITFYMADRYNLTLSNQQQQVLMAWDRSYPVSDWEKERDRRIAFSMGHHNPFVTGERRWVPGYRPFAEGVTFSSVNRQTQDQPGAQIQASAASTSGPVRGNSRSHVYHLSKGCPSYDQIHDGNRVEFDSEAAAVKAGYRKAGNCL